jgi:hypothetical protein
MRRRVCSADVVAAGAIAREKAPVISTAFGTSSPMPE